MLGGPRGRNIEFAGHPWVLPLCAPVGLSETFSRSGAHFRPTVRHDEKIPASTKRFVRAKRCFRTGSGGSRCTPKRRKGTRNPYVLGLRQRRCLCAARLATSARSACRQPDMGEPCEYARTRARMPSKACSRGALIGRAERPSRSAMAFVRHLGVCTQYWRCRLSHSLRLRWKKESPRRMRLGD